MYTALAHLFRATFLAVLFIISNRATRGKANPCLKTFLGCLLAVLFLVPLNIPIMQVELPANTENSFIAEKEQGTEVSPAPPDEITPGGEQPGAANASKNFLSAKAAVWAVYTLGAGITLFCTVYRYRKEVKSLLRCGRAPSAGENEIYLRLCQKHGLRKAPVLLVCPPFVIGSSLTFGIFRPTVIISEKFPPKDYAMILEHELTHCKRRDSLKKALLALVSVFYWFNPIMHAFVCEMNGLCEEACDETLLKNSGEEQREAYCLLLIQTALSKSAEKKFIFSAFKGGKRIMKQRITSIISKKSKLITALFLVTVVLVATLTSAIYVTTPPENIKAVYFPEPQQILNVSAKKDDIENYYTNKYHNIEYTYSVDSDEINISGVINGTEFDVVGTFVSPSYNGARLVYKGTDTLGNFNVKCIVFMIPQQLDDTELPIKDYDINGKAGHRYNGWFSEYAKENVQYKTNIQLTMNPVGTDDIAWLEIFTEDDFIRDFITKRDLKFADVDEKATYEIEMWGAAWYKEHGCVIPKD